MKIFFLELWVFRLTIYISFDNGEFMKILIFITPGLFSNSAQLKYKMVISYRLYIHKHIQHLYGTHFNLRSLHRLFALFLIVGIPFLELLPFPVITKRSSRGFCRARIRLIFLSRNVSNNIDASIKL